MKRSVTYFCNLVKYFSFIFIVSPPHSRRNTLELRLRIALTHRLPRETHGYTQKPEIQIAFVIRLIIVGTGNDLRENVP